MVIHMLFWWYQKGWGIFVNRVFEKLRSIIDGFSLGTILRTFFAPFRQIDTAAPMNGTPLGIRVRAFFDRLLSRMIGAVVRLFILIAGLITVLLSSLVGFAGVIIWPFVPLFPIAGIVLTCMQVAI